MMSKLAVSLGMVMVCAMGFAQAGGDANAGKTKSAPCAACHGADGNSANPAFPSLAGQHAGYIAKQLADFKAGENRVDATMSAMAMPLSPEDMADLGAYYAAQTPKGGQASPESVTSGEQMYRGGNAKSGVAACMSCHGPSGAGNLAAKFPALSGQHAAYTAKALGDFKMGARSNDAGQMMRTIAAKMTEKEIKAVAEYISGLH